MANPTSVAFPLEVRNQRTAYAQMSLRGSTHVDLYLVDDPQNDGPELTIMGINDRGGMVLKFDRIQTNQLRDFLDTQP